ncbi:MAG: PA14 domain-containing protein, partial [Rhodoglobus sp.]
MMLADTSGTPDYFDGSSPAGPSDEIYAWSGSPDASASTKTSAVAGLAATDNWAIRATGLVTFPDAGTYTFKTYADDATRLWVNDVLQLDNWAAGVVRWSTAAQTITVTAGETRRIRLEYADLTGTASLQLHWTKPNGTTEIVPGSALKPDYGLANGTATEDAAPAGSGLSDSQVPDTVTALEYTHPWLGAATASIIDPSGLNLRTETTYEAPGSAWLRRLTKRMPAAVAASQSAATAGSTFTHWGDKEQLGSVICGLPSTTPQSGFLKQSTGPTPATGSAVVTQFVYDVLGRTVGTKRTGDSAWTCVTFDSRGRSTTVSYPAYGGSSARTVTNTYAVSGNPLLTSVSDPTGTLTSTGDLLGRTVSSTDVWGTVTTPTYEVKTGRVLSVSTTPPGGTASVQVFTYDLDGKVETVKLDGSVIADPVYASNQLLQSVSYLNGSSLSSITRNATGATTGISWAFPNTTTPAVPTNYPATTVHTTGFETGPDGWSATSGTVTSSTAHGGSLSAVLEQTTSTPAALTQTFTGLTVGRSYTVEAWLATTDLNTVTVTTSVGVDGIGGTPTTATPAVGSTVTWVKTTYPFTATATSHTVHILASAPTNDASLLIDDVTVTKDAWTDPGSPTSTPQPAITDSVVRSQTGRILRNTLTDGTTTETSTYTYDAAGRLTQATIPQHVLTYEFASSGGCGVNTAAGRSGNRTGFTDTKNSVVVTDVDYCYDWADRLTSTNATTTGGNPVLNTDLSTIGAPATLAYDTHGNTTTLADQTLTYDVADRHTRTTLSDGTTVTYTRDATGRVVARITDAPGTANDSTLRYTFAGGALFAVLNGTNQLIQRELSLPGGVSLSIPAAGGQVWAYPNLHGDIILTTDAAGLRQGVRSSYDPFGQPIAPNGDIGTPAADDSIPDTSPGDADYGYVGGHDKLYEHQG